MSPTNVVVSLGESYPSIAQSSSSASLQIVSHRTSRVAVALVALCLLEVGRRFVFGGAEQTALIDMADHDDGQCPTLRKGAAVDYTGWLLRIPPVRQEVNAAGYRGALRSRERADDEAIRIAAMGDSFTYGTGVTDVEALPEVLEVALQEKMPHPVEVMNFGIFGISLDDVTARYRSFASRWSPDLVLYFLWADDLDQPLCSWWQARWPALGYLIHHVFLVRLVHMAFVAAGFVEDIMWLAPYLPPRRGDYESRSVQLQESLARLVTAAGQRGARVAVVALGDPIARSAPSAEARSVLVHTMSRLGIPWLDARDWVLGAADVRLPVLPGEFHFTAASNAVAARSVASWLATTDLLEPPSRVSRVGTGTQVTPKAPSFASWH